MYNRVDTIISDADLQDIRDAYAVIKDKMSFLIGLTDEERTGGWIRSPKALLFMRSVFMRSKDQPQNFPGVSMAAFEKDLKLIEQIDLLESMNANIARQLKDTRLRLTKEGAEQAMAVYNMMQVFHDSGIPGGEGFKDLQAYLPRTGKKSKPKKENP